MRRPGGRPPARGSQPLFVLRMKLGPHISPLCSQEEFCLVSSLTVWSVRSPELTRHPVCVTVTHHTHITHLHTFLPRVLPSWPSPSQIHPVPFSSFMDYVRALLIGSTALTRCDFRSAYFGEPLSGSLTLPSVRSSSLTSALSVAASGEWAHVRLERSRGDPWVPLPYVQASSASLTPLIFPVMAELCVPEICMLRSPSPVSRDVTVFGVGVFKEVIEMSSYGWALIQSDWRLSKKRKCGHTDTRDAHRATRGGHGEKTVSTYQGEASGGSSLPTPGSRLPAARM